MTLIAYKANVKVEEKEYDDRGYMNKYTKDIIDSLVVEEVTKSMSRTEELVINHIVANVDNSECKNIEIEVIILSISSVEK